MQRKRILMLGVLTGCASAPSVVDGFVVDPTCGRAAPLGLTIGQPAADGSFQVIDEDAPPQRVFGPQGGQHLLLDLVLADPSDEASATLVVLQAARCAQEEPAACETDVLGRVEVITRPGDAQHQPLADGTLRLGSYFLVLRDWPEEEPRSVTASVQDACGRSAATSIWVAPQAQQDTR